MRKQVSFIETPTSIGTLARGLDVLELFAAAGPELSQKQISELLALPMPTVHRLVAVLTERGWLDRDAGTRQLRLGLEMARLVPALLQGLRLPELARPHLLALAADVQETVNVAILEGAEVVYLASETADRLLTSRVPVGMRLPAHCTALGKCLLAQLPEELTRSTLGEEPYARRTDRTLTTWAELAPDLAAIRDTEVAVSDEEYEIGLVSIAVPVRWIDGPGRGAVNVSLPAGRATESFRHRLARRLRATARAIDDEMEGRP
jgi:IclR family transcriptional regulator, acetate operon repressor